MRRGWAVLAAGALALSGCGQLDLTPEGDPGRVATGRVELSDGNALPAGARVTVRVVAPAAAGMPPEVLGSQALTSSGSAPVDFRVVYRAEDEVLRRGLNVDARVSIDGKVRYFNMNQYALTFANAAEPHRIVVNPVSP